MSHPNHDNLIQLIKGALAEQGHPLRKHECERMQRFLDQLDAANEENGGPQRVAQVIAAFSEDGQVESARHTSTAGA
jgi:hypothetical protein